MWMLLVGCGLVDTETEHSPVTEDGPFTRVEVAIGAGDVLLQGDAEATGADGAFTATFSDTPPDVDHYVDDEGVLHVVGECTALQAVCDVSLALTVPSAVDVVIESGAGTVTIEGIAGDVAAETGAGDLCVRDVEGYVDLETGAGDLSLVGMAGELVAETGSGDVEAVDVIADRVRLASGSGDVVLRQVGPFSRAEVASGSGDLDLVVPAGAYALTAESGSGDVDVLAGIRSDAQATSVLVAQTGSGDVTIAAP
jgi:hypothetical protein